MAGSARSAVEDVRKKGRAGRVSVEDQHTIRGMLARGDRIVDVAYWFGVSPSTVHKIKMASARMAWTLNDATRELPPPGPYLLVRKAVYDKVQAERDASVLVITELEGLLNKYRTSRSLSGTVPNTTH